MARKMKDSGIEWIGEIPVNWELRKGKSLYSIATGKLDVNAEDPEGEYPFFTCSMYPKKISTFSFDCEALLVAGNGLVGYTQYYSGKFDAYQRTYVLSSFKDCYPKFLKYYVSNNLSVEVEPKSNGSVITFIKLGDLQGFNVALPPIDEQKRIAMFLDTKCSYIDSVIEQTRASIEEYKKLKQAVITLAVTKGIHPDRPMKDSGIEWIGEIPENWSIMPIKRILSEQTKKTIDGEGMQLSVNQKKGVVKSEESGAANPSQSTVDWKYVSVNDIVFNKYKAHSGVFFVSNYDGIVTFNYSVFRCLEDNCPQFFEYQFKTPGCIDEFKKQMRGVGDSISPLYTRDLFKIFVAVPPAAEQYEIAHYILENNKEIDGLIEKKEEIIEELNTYKKSLIYEYVTGKKEVPA